MSIPKKLHYVWMGRGQKSQETLEFMQTWKKHLPDYELVEWNEDNFDINSVPYVKQAYENKKWAFVSDYVRLYAIYTCGGIYVDTDVEILKPLDRFLEHGAFSGFESPKNIPTGIMASEKGNLWAKALLDDYEGRDFIDKNGKMDLTTNVVTITRISVKQFGLKCNNQYQVLNEDVHIYPKEYFCPFDYTDKKSKEQKHAAVTENTYTIHHFSGSWHTPMQKIRTKILGLLGENITNKLREVKAKKKEKEK